MSTLIYYNGLTQFNEPTTSGPNWASSPSSPFLVQYAPATTGANVTLSQNNTLATTINSGSMASIINYSSSTSTKQYIEFVIASAVGTTGDHPYVGFFGGNGTVPGQSYTYYNTGLSNGTGQYARFTLGTGAGGPGNVGFSSYSHSGAIQMSITPVIGDIIMFAFDTNNGKAWVGYNGVWASNAGGVGNPSTGANALWTGVTGPIYPTASPYSSNESIALQGTARSWSYNPPTGFIAFDGTTR